MTIILPLDDQGKMLAFVDRRHPAYHDMIDHWTFCEATYLGGREWFKHNIHKYIKEGMGEFGDRQKRAYRFNHTREVISLVTKYIFKEGIIRNETDAPPALRAFWKKAMLNGFAIDALLKRAADKSSAVGRSWVIIDNNIQDNLSLAEQKKTNTGIYGYVVRQQDVLDYSFDDEGSLHWLKYRLPHRDDADPIVSSGHVATRYMLWTTEEWVLLEERIKSSSTNVTTTVMSTMSSGFASGIGSVINEREIVEIDRGVNPIGTVPAVQVDNMESDDPYAPPGLVDEIAYLDRAIANYLSNLDAIIQDQTFSQLIVPGQSLLPGDEGYDKITEMGTKRIFTYDDENGGKPEYISPDAAQAMLIITTIKMIIGEIYHSVGMAGERTKQDNAQGIDNSSGVAKAYDFERMNALLCAKADMLDRAENQIAKLVCLWADEAEPADDLIKYPETYDVRGLPDEFEIAQNLALLEAPPSLRRQQMTVVAEKMFPRLAKALMAKIIDEMKDWPKDPLEQMSAVMQLQSSVTGAPPKGGTKMTTQPGAPAPAPAGGNKKGLDGPTGKGVSKQGQAGTK